MIRTLKANDRGRTEFGWLDSRHSFSFGEYYDPRNMGFRSLRVMNEDWIAPGKGFGTHPHRDMEIVTYVLEGSLTHRDSLGTGSVIRAGELQRMTAGTGIAHSEFNPSETEATHLYQIWLHPERPGLTPGYEQVDFSNPSADGGFRLIASRDGRDGSLTIHQDAGLYLASIAPGGRVEHRFAPGRSGWLQVLRGRVTLDGEVLDAGDGAAIEGVEGIDVAADEASELLLFDLA